jgi:ferredoxin
MAKLTFGKETVTVKSGEDIRSALLRNNISPYNDRSGLINCRGLGTCGTCAIEVTEGEVNQRTRMESWRLGFPPHQKGSGLRLACQCVPKTDITIEKHPGFWGQKMTKVQED